MVVRLESLLDFAPVERLARDLAMAKLELVVEIVCQAMKRR